MLKLDLNAKETASNIGSRLKSVYDRIAAGDDYQRNDRSLSLIMICVITLSAAMTGFVNAFAHINKLGFYGAVALGLCITAFVEKFYFTIQHGLRTVYQSRTQRMIAHVCCRIIQISMIMNGMVVAAWVAEFPLPQFLIWWSRWSIAVNFALALVGVSELRAADAVVADNIRKLSAEAQEEALTHLQQPVPGRGFLIRTALRLKRWVDGYRGAKSILFNKPNIYTGNDQFLLPSKSDQFLLSGGTLIPENESSKMEEEDSDEYNDILINQSPPHQEKKQHGSRAKVIKMHTQSDSISIQQLRSLLPEVINGWWRLQLDDNSYSIKLGWRENNRRSQTLTFPRLGMTEFQAIFNDENPKELMKDCIVNQLRRLAEDPGKLSKVQSAADKLSINLFDELDRKQA